MLLNDKTTNHMVEILSISDLIDPYKAEVAGRYHYGEEMQDPEMLSKSNLVFLSREALPKCWMDPHYRDEELIR